MTETGAIALAASVALYTSLHAEAQEMKRQVTVRVVEGGESATPYGDCRRMLIGPGVNQPAPYPGYGGFVGWQAPVRLRNGTWLVGFSAGYWHASPPRSQPW